jgi:two-component system, OmpR family, sensor histidine kinase VanS
MLAPLTRITDATRLAATGSLYHRIQLEGRNDEFRALADALNAMLAQLEPTRDSTGCGRANRSQDDRYFATSLVDATPVESFRSVVSQMSRNEVIHRRCRRWMTG